MIGEMGNKTGGHRGLRAARRHGKVSSATHVAYTADGGFDDQCPLPADGSLRLPRLVKPPRLVGLAVRFQL
jgi:hypothetical protein